MNEYIHDEYCDTRLEAGECNCYVAVILLRDARIAAAEALDYGEFYSIRDYRDAVLAALRGTELPPVPFPKTQE